MTVFSGRDAGTREIAISVGWAFALCLAVTGCTGEASRDTAPALVPLAQFNQSEHLYKRLVDFSGCVNNTEEMNGGRKSVEGALKRSGMKANINAIDTDIVDGRIRFATSVRFDESVIRATLEAVRLFSEFNSEYFLQETGSSERYESRSGLAISDSTSFSVLAGTTKGGGKVDRYVNYQLLVGGQSASFSYFAHDTVSNGKKSTRTFSQSDGSVVVFEKFVRRLCNSTGAKWTFHTGKSDADKLYSVMAIVELHPN